MEQHALEVANAYLQRIDAGYEFALENGQIEIYITDDDVDEYLVSHDALTKLFEVLVSTAKAANGL